MSQSKELIILQLYPNKMNIYGDWGNVLTVQRRAEWHGYAPKLIEYNEGDTFPDNVDIIIGGGGQDSGQTVIQDDLLGIGPRLIELAQNDTPMLVICGLYQLFGHSFTTLDGTVIQGIGMLDLETIGGTERLIGNIVTRSHEFGQIIGYENHSGQTYLGQDMTPLGMVEKGAGNNTKDGTEGVRYRNVIGSYLHGSLLPKNPNIADFLIEQAAIQRYGEFTSGVIDDTITDQARTIALGRPR